MTKTQDIIKRYISNRNAKAAISKWKKMTKEQRAEHIKKMVDSRKKKKRNSLSTGA